MSNAYRYGFNGKENDDEVKGEGNQQDYGMRIYDPRVGRFLSVDPIANQYPELTPYQFASNRPIDGIDQDGLEFRKAPGMFMAYGTKNFSNLKVTEGEVILSLREKYLPEYYKLLKVSNIKGLESATQNTQFKLDIMSPRVDGPPADQTPKGGREAAEGAAGVVLGMLVDLSPEVSSLNIVKEQSSQFKTSLNLVNSAAVQGLIPEQFQKDAGFKADLANFIFDGTQASGNGEKAEAYNNVVSLLGRELYSNKDKVLTGSYKRLPESVEVIKTKSGLDNFKPKDLLIKHFGKDKLKKAVNDYNKAKEGCINCNSINKKNP